MKNVLKLILVTICITSIFSSCDIQKKRYSKGYTIGKNKVYIKNEKPTAKLLDSASPLLVPGVDTLNPLE